MQNKIQSRDNLKKKTIVGDAWCELCGAGEEYVVNIVGGDFSSLSFR